MLEGIRADRFYIVSAQPEVKEGIAGRGQDRLALRNRTLRPDRFVEVTPYERERPGPGEGHGRRPPPPTSDGLLPAVARSRSAARPMPRSIPEKTSPCSG